MSYLSKGPYGRMDEQWGIIVSFPKGKCLKNITKFVILEEFCGKVLKANVKSYSYVKNLYLFCGFKFTENFYRNSGLYTNKKMIVIKYILQQ